jgi:D-alanyl-D-alanine carboxypeptidase
MERFRAQDTVLKASVLALAGAVITVVSIAVAFAVRDEATPLDTRPTNLASAVGSTTKTSSPKRTFPDTTVSARAAIVVDLSTGEAVYAKNADAVLPLASITKLMTTYVAARRGVLDTTHTVDATDLATEGESGLVAGDTLTVEQLIALALVPSSNDSATAIARATADNVTRFVGFMNDEAKRLGAKNMEYRNPTGLDVDLSTAGAVGSARDVSKLIGALASEYRDVVRPSINRTLTETGTFGIAYRYENTNPTVASVAGLIVSKTGFTDLAGGNLAIAFDAGVNEPYAIVVLGSTQEGRFDDVAALASSTSAYLKSGE